ncbi:unnamed protein product, partial [Candidula unifasciata]
DACDQVKCPKLKVCVVNMQGLPLCTCPNPFVCRGIKKREVCGTDGRTYTSRCHMRVASCDEGVPVRKKHKGPCTEQDIETFTESISEDRKAAKKTKKRKRRKGEEEAGTDSLAENKKKKDRKRKRRKSGKNRGKSRARRHKGKNQGAVKTFEETFSHYKWNA